MKSARSSDGPPPRAKSTRAAHYFAFSAKDWRSSESVSVMSLAERGAFVELLAVSWLASEEPCTIPADDATIAALLRVSLDEWKAIAPRVLAEFDETTSRGRLRNARLWSEYKSMRSAHRKKSQGGKASALRRRDGHGRLLPASDQDTTKIASASRSLKPVAVDNTKTTTSAAAKGPRAARVPPSWLDACAREWEAKFGAGTFPYGEAGSHLKALHKAGHLPAELADYLRRYLSRTETQYVSLARFAKTYAEYRPVDGAAIVDEFGTITAYGEKALRIA